MSNREAMPNVAKIVDEFRAVFGPEVKVTYCKEGGIEKGKRMPEGVIPVVFKEESQSAVLQGGKQRVRKGRRR